MLVKPFKLVNSCLHIFHNSWPGFDFSRLGKQYRT